MTGNKNDSRLRLSRADDAPELDTAWFAKADLHIGGKLVRRGRPRGSGSKELVSLRLDREVLAAFRNTGPGWQSRINETLARSARRLARA